MKNRMLVLPIHWSPSRTETSARCHRRHLLEHFLLRKMYESDALLFGTSMHTGIETWWASLQDGASYIEALEKARQMLLTDWPIDDSKAQPHHTSENALVLLDEYTKSARLTADIPDPDQWQLISIEERLKRLEGPLELQYKLDRVLQHKGDGRIAIIDYKTSGNTNDWWADNMRRSVQQRIYNRAAQLHYDAPVAYHFVEGQNKKDGSLRYEWISLGWTDAYISEAWELGNRLALRDLDALMEAYHDPYRPELAPELEDPDEQMERELERLLTNWTLTYASFNLQDCRSYGVECPYRRLCDASPDERPALLNEYPVAEPWIDT